MQQKLPTPYILSTYNKQDITILCHWSRLQLCQFCTQIMQVLTTSSLSLANISMKAWHLLDHSSRAFYRTSQNTALHLFLFYYNKIDSKQCTFETSIYIKIQSAPQVKILTEAYTFTACVNGKPHNSNNVTATSLPSSNYITRYLHTS